MPTGIKGPANTARPRSVKMRACKRVRPVRLPCALAQPPTLRVNTPQRPAGALAGGVEIALRAGDREFCAFLARD